MLTFSQISRCRVTSGRLMQEAIFQLGICFLLAAAWDMHCAQLLTQFAKDATTARLLEERLRAAGNPDATFFVYDAWCHSIYVVRGVVGL